MKRFARGDGAGSAEGVSSLPATPAAMASAGRELVAIRSGPSFWQRLRRDTLAVVSLAFILIMLMLAIVGPTAYQQLAAPDLRQYRTSDYQDYVHINTNPSSLHWLGADALGRDTLTRLLMGLRVSFLVAAFVEAINVGLGATLGLMAGYFGKVIDFAVSRVADMLFAFPGLLLAILLSAVFGQAAQNLAGDIGRLLMVAGALALVSWPLLARYVRAETMSLRPRDFIVAAHSIGATDSAVIGRHVLPNVAGLIVTAATLDVSGVILNESVLSLLGLGIQPPGSSLGLMISQAIPDLRVNAFQVFVPSAMLTLLVLAFSFLGDAVRDALDPSSR